MSFKVLLSQLLLILFLVSPVETSADEPCETAREQATPLGTTEKALRGLMNFTGEVFFTRRCQDVNPNSFSLVPCERATRDLFQALDCQSFRFHPCFATELSEILLSPRAGEYLRALAEEAQKAISEKRKFNLWEWTLRFHGGDRKKATQWIAVLFQGFPGLMLDYLKKHDSRSDRMPLGALVATTQAIYGLHSERPDLIEFYPGGVSSKGVGIYHYYVPAYLAQRLSESPTRHGKLAANLPFLFNGTYELIHITPDEASSRASNGIIGSYERISLPEHFDASRNKHALAATYLGLQGSYWAAGREGEIPAFEEFARDYSANPREELRKLFAEGK